MAIMNEVLVYFFSPVRFWNTTLKQATIPFSYASISSFAAIYDRTHTEIDTRILKERQNHVERMPPERLPRQGYCTALLDGENLGVQE
jgi:hypothetical protein